MFVLLIVCLISLSLFSLSSCTQKSSDNNIIYSDFPQTIELEAKVMPLDTALLHYPFRIDVQGDKVVVMDLHGTDYFFHAFHYPDFRYSASFGKRGDAPGELLSSEGFRWNGDFLWALDAGKSQLIRFGFDLSGDSLLRKETVSLDKNLLRVLDFAQYDDSTFIIPDYSGDNRFCWVNSQGQLLHKMGGIPSVNEDALKNSRPALSQAWRSFIDYNPRNSVLAAVTQLGEVLEVYNLKDSTRIVSIGPHGEPEFQISEGYGIPTGIMGFSDVQVTDNAIYAVFHGRSFKEIAQSAQKGIELPDGGQYIYVFSLKGEPLCKYKLDHYVYSISVNEEKDVIHATDVNKDEPILEYKLNK